jgi:hypothetical protein
MQDCPHMQAQKSRTYLVEVQYAVGVDLSHLGFGSVPWQVRFGHVERLAELPAIMLSSP